jgi:hypothetical protein
VQPALIMQGGHNFDTGVRHQATASQPGARATKKVENNPMQSSA